MVPVCLFQVYQNHHTTDRPPGIDPMVNALHDKFNLMLRMPLQDAMTGMKEDNSKPIRRVETRG